MQRGHVEMRDNGIAARPDVRYDPQLVPAPLGRGMTGIDKRIARERSGEDAANPDGRLPRLVSVITQRRAVEDTEIVDTNRVGRDCVIRLGEAFSRPVYGAYDAVLVDHRYVVLDRVKDPCP